jgi:ABC-type antimicrobial peptide transport system permease subunit
VLATVVRSGLGITTVGVVLGLGGAVALGRFMQSVLYGVEPLDPLTFGSMAAVLMSAAALASWLPARRAASLDPAETLRAD